MCQRLEHDLATIWAISKALLKSDTAGSPYLCFGESNHSQRLYRQVNLIATGIRWKMSKNLKNANLGDVVRIEFDDHSEGSQHIVFEVFGRVLEKTRRSFVVGSWLYADDPKEIDENACVWTILRAGIRSIQILSPREEPWQPKKTQQTSRRKPANSASGVPDREKPENADTILPEQLASQESNTTIIAPSTSQTIF